MPSNRVIAVVCWTIGHVGDAVEVAGCVFVHVRARVSVRMSELRVGGEEAKSFKLLQICESRQGAANLARMRRREWLRHIQLLRVS